MEGKKRIQSQQESINQQEIRKLSDARNKAIKRKIETVIENSKRRKSDAELKARTRKMETEREQKLRRKSDAKLKVRTREMETVAEKKVRRKSDAELKARTRKHEEIRKKLRMRKCISYDKDKRKIISAAYRDFESEMSRTKKIKKKSIQRKYLKLSNNPAWKKMMRNQQSRYRNPTEIEKAVKKFLRSINSFAIYPCTICHRNLYKKMVKRYIESNYRSEIDATLRDVDENQWICKTCHRYMKKEKLPPQSYTNKLHVENEELLSTLTNFESRLISKRIPFMKIIALPKGKQKGIIGNVINVPSDCDATCSELPRSLYSSGIIPVKLKRKLEYKGYVIYENIRPNKVSYIIK